MPGPPRMPTWLTGVLWRRPGDDGDGRLALFMCATAASGLSGLVPFRAPTLGRSDNQAHALNGLRLIPESDHKIEPIKDSWCTQNGGLPASLLHPFDYRIEGAVCMVCSRPIVAESFLGDWVHFSRD